MVTTNNIIIFIIYKNYTRISIFLQKQLYSTSILPSSAAFEAAQERRHWFVGTARLGLQNGVKDMRAKTDRMVHQTCKNGKHAVELN